MTPQRRRSHVGITVVLVVGIIVGIVATISLIVMMSAAAPPGGPTAEQFPAGPTVAFYGDSYTLGTGASHPTERWSTRVSVPRGWNEFNPSVNGLGFVTNRSSVSGSDLVQQIIAADPDLIIVTMGLNDNFLMPAAADEIRAAITADFTTLASSLPEARIIAVEPFWYTDARPASVDQISGWVATAAAAVDADHIGGASHWIEGHPEWIGADGLHPSDAGYAQIAARMNNELAKLGL